MTGNDIFNVDEYIETIKKFKIKRKNIKIEKWKQYIFMLSDKKSGILDNFINFYIDKYYSE